PTDAWYQWLKNGTNIPGGEGFGTNFAAYTISSPVTNDSGNYSVVFSNYYGVAITSSVQTVTVLQPSLPLITVQPQSGGRYASAPSYKLGVPVLGTPPFSYQWKQITGGVTNTLSGQTNQTLTLNNIQPANAGNYFVTVSNFLGATNSIPAAFNVI